MDTLSSQHNWLTKKVETLRCHIPKTVGLCSAAAPYHPSSLCGSASEFSMVRIRPHCWTEFNLIGRGVNVPACLNPAPSEWYRPIIPTLWLRLLLEPDREANRGWFHSGAFVMSWVSLQGLTNEWINKHTFFFFFNVRQYFHSLWI